MLPTQALAWSGSNDVCDVKGFQSGHHYMPHSLLSETTAVGVSSARSNLFLISRHMCCFVPERFVLVRGLSRVAGCQAPVSGGQPANIYALRERSRSQPTSVRAMYVGKESR